MCRPLTKKVIMQSLNNYPRMKIHFLFNQHLAGNIANELIHTLLLVVGAEIKYDPVEKASQKAEIE